MTPTDKDDALSRERPDFPEETRPGGHDSEPQPLPRADDPVVGGGRNAGVGVGSTGERQRRAGASQDAVDTAFLSEGFNIPPAKSSQLVSDGNGADATRVEGEARDLMSKRDPLAGVPSPKQPAEEFTPDNDETRLKPVLHDNNRRSGSG